MKSGIKHATKVTLNLSSNLIGNYNDETNFPHELLLTNKQVSKIRKAFANHSSANIKFSKTQFSKMISSGSSIIELINPFRVADKIVNKRIYLIKKRHLMM